jgi:hypothetical protein
MPTTKSENVAYEASPKWSEILPQLRAWMRETYPQAEYATFIVCLSDDLPAVVLPVVLPA